MNYAIRILFSIMAVTTPATAFGQLLVAHRGASHEAPENTLAAFVLAWERGADGVEGDFRLTRDGRLACLHDSDTQRVAGRKLVASESTLAELRALDVGGWKHPRYRGQRVPTLEEVAATVPEGKLLVVELKSGPEIVPPLAAALERVALRHQQVAIISFDDQTIAACARRLPEIRRHWLTGFKQSEAGAWTPPIDRVTSTLKNSHATGLGAQANREALGDDAIRALAAGGAPEFHVWTVDDPAVARFYLDRGAEWITTNRPGWLREQLVKGD